MNTNNSSSFLTSKLFRKFLVWFLLIALVPAIYLSYSSYKNAQQIIEKGELVKLSSIAEQRAYEIKTFYMERQRDINAQAENPFIINAMERMIEQFTKSGLNSVPYRTEEKKIIPFLSNLKKQLDLHDILFIAPDGDIVFTLEKEADLGTNLITDAYKDTELEKAFKSSMQRQTTSISAFKLYEPSGKPTAFFAVPILSADQVLGIMVFQLDPSVIYALATNYIGMGESGETVIAAMEGDYAMVAAPLRHNPQAAFKMKIKMGSGDALPIQDAVKGNEGSGISVDYRGKEILAVWKYIPKLNWGLVVKIDTEEAYAPATSFYKLTLIIGIITILFVLVFAVFVSRSIVNPVIGLKQNLGSIAKGELPAKLDILSRDEIGEINESMGQVIDSFKEVVSQANVIASGDYRVDIALRSDKDELGIALQKMTGSLRTAKDETERNDWLKSGQSELEDHMRGDQSTEELCRNIIAFVAKYLKAQIGTLYVNDGDGIFKLKASFAYKTRKNLSNEFKHGEGLIGQAALEKQSLILTNVPDDYITVTSGLGEKKPKSILVIPFIYNETVTGVLEIGSFDEFSELQTTFLQEISDGIAIAINSAQARVQLQDALEVTQKQTEDLRLQQEELQTTNEELEEQTLRLQASEEELKTQQEELQVTNEELEEKTHSLEEERKNVTQRNRELQKTQKELEQKAKELAITSRYKSEFLANMSHELRTPLNSLLILANNLVSNKKKNLDKEQLKSATIIEKSGQDLLNLINEILDLSRIEAGKIAINIGKARLSEISDGITANFKPLADEKGLKLSVNISKNLPETIQTDRQRLEQIIKNLMSNATKFTERGEVNLDFFRPGAEVNLSKSGLDRQKAVAISVTDTGIGIPKDKQLEIFEAFQQADGSTSRLYGGTGLGLSISRELVKLLGGEIQLESSEGKGSTFTVYLPEELKEKEALGLEITEDFKFEDRKHPQVASFEPAPTIEDDRDNIGNKDRIILTIEDDLKFAEILYKFCHERNFKCIHAGDGETGIELAETYKPDAIILDIRLPGIEGWGVLEALKNNSNTRHIPVHMMSVEEESIDAYKKGAIGYLTKPVTDNDLEQAFSRIEDLLDRSIKDLLIVEDDEIMRKNIIKLIGNSDIKIKEAGTGKEALKELRSKTYDCIILDLNLPDMSGFEVLSNLEGLEGTSIPPVIIYTGKDLTREEEYQLEKSTSSIIVKGVMSQERLLDETALFLHRVVDDLPARKRKMISRLHDEDFLFQGKKILVADDDMRNVFAISKVLEEKGMDIYKAADGQEALDMLDKEPHMDLVLMDIMMPVMDGYEATRHIRSQERFRSLPILAITAKAMREDRDKCIAAGANDYIPKPVEIDRLISLMRVWLYK
jgi:tubulin-specific chaperone A